MSRILLTGGTGKIGSILVKSLINDGHEVVFTTTDSSKALRLVEEVKHNKEKLHFIVSKFIDESSSDSITSNLPFDIDVIIHNARSVDSLKINKMGLLTMGQFQEEYFMAVIFPYILTNKILEKSKELKDIIMVSSMYGVVAPNPNLYENFEMQSPINYGISKAAQIHLTKELAVRLAPKNIKVNCISFGGIEGRVDNTFKSKYSALNPMGRMLNEKDIYPPFQFIINNPHLAINGENIKIDGGWTIW